MSFYCKQLLLHARKFQKVQGSIISLQIFLSVNQPSNTCISGQYIIVQLIYILIMKYVPANKVVNKILCEKKTSNVPS